MAGLGQPPLLKMHIFSLCVLASLWLSWTTKFIESPCSYCRDLSLTLPLPFDHSGSPASSGGSYPAEARESTIFAYSVAQPVMAGWPAQHLRIADWRPTTAGHFRSTASYPWRTEPCRAVLGPERCSAVLVRATVPPALRYSVVAWE